jgi:hypothetical protein
MSASSPLRTFTSLEEVSDEYSIFHYVNFDYDNEIEILRIYNNQIQYDETATYPEYLLPHFSAYAYRHNDKKHAMKILRKLSQTNANFASDIMIHVHFDAGHNTQGKNCIKQLMKRNCGKAYNYLYEQKMQYLENNLNLKLSKRNQILESAAKCLNIAFNLGYTSAINHKYRHYMKYCEGNNIPFSDEGLGETAKYFMELGCKQATYEYAMHLFDTNRHAESKPLFVVAMESNECCLPIEATVNAHKNYIYMKKNGIVADFFSEQEIMERVERIVLGCGIIFSGLPLIDNPVIELVEFCARNGEYKKCANILELIGILRDNVKEILPTLFSIIKTYSLSIPKSLIGWYQYENYCNNVVAEYECQFCLETVTSFIPFGCENAEHGCCKDCFNKCSVCPYKCA